MPSYIELLKQASLPAASDPSRVVFGITDQGAITVSNDSGSVIGGSIATVTPTEFQSLIASSSLSPGTLYYVTGADSANDLYGGNDVVVQATTVNSYNPKGVAKFYNAKYDQTTPGYGIWTPYTRFYANNLLGTFATSENITGDGGQTATAFASISEYGLTFVYNTAGDWTTVTSITGDATSATANVSSVVTPIYNFDDRVIWGGKVWKNLTGNIGTSLNAMELNTNDWEVIPYNDTDYSVIWDEIEYDAANDFISMRRDRANNETRQTYFEWYEADGARAIRLFQWGNEMNSLNYRGFSNNKIDGSSYVELVNFRGDYFVDNTFFNSTGFGGNQFEVGSRIQRNIFCDMGGYGNFFGGNNAYVEDNEFVYCGFFSNTINGYGSISANRIHDSYFGDNLVLDSEIYSNSIKSSTVSSNKLWLGDYSQMNENQLTNANMQSNTIMYSYINRNVLTTNSYISNNNLISSAISTNLTNQGSSINGANLNGEEITNNALFNNNSITSPSTNAFIANII